ncbi:MAG: hypothetical protein ACYTFK_12955 [Planctomycetota bacterium]|jgi:hypothetical protein
MTAATCLMVMENIRDKIGIAFYTYDIRNFTEDDILSNFFLRAIDALEGPDDALLAATKDLIKKSENMIIWRKDFISRTIAAVLATVRFGYAHSLPGGG